MKNIILLVRLLLWMWAICAFACIKLIIICLLLSIAIPVALLSKVIEHARDILLLLLCAWCVFVISFSIGISIVWLLHTVGILS